jgi:hypothetical protein
MFLYMDFTTFQSAWLIWWVFQTLWECCTIPPSSKNHGLSCSLWIADVLSRCTRIFFWSIWWLKKLWWLVQLLCRNPQYFHLCVKLSLRKGHSVKFVCSWEQCYRTIIIRVSFMALSVNWYKNRFLPLVRKLSASPLSMFSWLMGLTIFMKLPVD